MIEILLLYKSILFQKKHQKEIAKLHRVQFLLLTLQEQKITCITGGFKKASKRGLNLISHYFFFFLFFS